MTTSGARNFSIEHSDCKAIDEHVESVGHPLVRQILTQVLAEGSDEMAIGSSFGEGVAGAG